MFDAGSILAQLKIDKGGWDTSIRAIEKDAEVLGQKAKETSAAMGGLQGSTDATEKSTGALWKQFVAGGLVLDGIKKIYNGVVGVFREGIAGAIESEQAQIRLKTALDSTGRTTEAMLPRLSAYAVALSKETLYTDEQAMATMTLLAQLTHLDAAGIQKATKGAMGLAAVMHSDLATATEKLIPLITGQTNALRGTGIVIDETLKGDERKAAVLERVAALYVRAQAETETYGGRIKDLGKWVDEVKESFGNAIVQNKSFNELIDKAKTAVVQLIESGKLEEWVSKISSALTYALDKLGRFIDYLDGIRRAGVTGGLAALADHLTGIDKATRGLETEGRVGVHAFAASLQVLKPTVAELREEIEKGPASWEAYKASMQATDAMLAANKSTITGWIDKGLAFLGLQAQHKGAINETGIAAKTTSGELGDLKKELGLTFTADLVSKIRNIETALRDYKGQLAPESEEKLRKELRGLQEQLGLAASGGLEVFRGSLANVKTEAIRTTTSITTLGETALKLGRIMPAAVLALIPSKKVSLDWGKVTETISQYWKTAMAEMASGALTFAGFIQGTFRSLALAIGEVFSQIATDALSSLGKIAGPIGALFGGLIGGILGVLADAIFGTGEAARKATPHLIDYAGALDMIERAATKAVETNKKLVEGWKDSSGRLEDFLGQLGQLTPTTDNFTKSLAFLSSYLEKIAKGLIDAEEASYLMSDGFDTLLRWAQEMGAEGSKAILDFILRARELGIEISSVTKYVQGELEKIPDALSALIDASDDTGTSVKDLGKLALTTFNSMLSSGVSFTDAVKQMKEPLAALRDKYKELGLGSDEALDRLFKIVGITEKHESLFTAIDANKQILTALGNSGWLTADALSTLAGNARSYYDQLLNAGMSADDALRAMGPTLQQIHDYAEAYGLTLDENTMRLIEQAEKAGSVKDKVDMGKEVQTTNTLLSEMRDIFVGIADKLGIVLDKIRDVGGATDAAKRGISSWVDPIDEAGRKIDDLGRKIGDLPGLPDLDLPSGSELPAYDLGGYVPTTGPAILHAGEFVIPPSRLVEMVGGISGGSHSVPASPGSITSKLILEMEGESIPLNLTGKVTRLLIKLMPELTRDERVLIHPRAVTVRAA